MGCSSFRKGDYVGRSFDYFYDNSASIVIRTDHSSDHFASIGVGGGGVGKTDTLTQNNIINNTIPKDYKELLPYVLVDGINENGVYINQNVLTREEEYGTTTGTNPGQPRCCINFFLRTILDKATSAKDAIRLCKEYDLYSVNSPTFKYETHYMIADPEDTYIVEFINNEVVYYGSSEITSEDPAYKGPIPGEKAIMTNFYLTGWNGDMPSLPTASTDKEDTNGLTKYACGLERYNTLAAGLDNVSSENTARELIRQVRYTQAYSKDLGEGFWYTEYTGSSGDSEITLATPHDDPDFVGYLGKVKERYSERERGRDVSKPGQGLWISNHQCVYNLNNLTLSIEPQESGKILEYSL